MNTDALISFAGFLGADPELRFTPSGKAVCSFSVAVARSRPDGNGGFDTGPTTWHRCSVWGPMGENAAQSLRKGSRVVVLGYLTSREYEHNGEKRTGWDVTVDELGVSVRSAVARPVKTSREPAPAEHDPWAGAAAPAPAATGHPAPVLAPAAV